MSTPTDREKIIKGKYLQLIRGLPCFGGYDKKVIEDVMDFVPADGDVIIAAFMKTGTTWMQYIVHQILTKGESFPAFNDALFTVVPHLELSGIEAVEKLPKPRLYRHHIPYNMMKQNTKAKVIYVYRKPEDTMVSFYYFRNEVHSPDFIELDDFVEDFLSGITTYGQYFDHILSYYRHKDDGNILFVSYEKLLVNRKKEIVRISKFLGAEYFNLLTQDETVMNKIMEHTDFSYMKKNLFLNFPKYVHNLGAKDQVFKRIDFFRNGRSGNGKKSLSEDQLQRVAELAKKKLEGTDILSEWYNN